MSVPIKNVTISDLDRLDALAGGEADAAFQMDEETFRAFYDRTARPLWSYLARITGSPQLADDLLQESYYRLLRVRSAWDSEAHRRAYLFRIATNLVRDGHRRDLVARAFGRPSFEQLSTAATERDPGEVSTEKTDLHRAMARLRPRDRALLWLAYAQGRAHAEIADALGLKTGSIKLLLFRARRRLARLLRGDGHPGGGSRSTSKGERRGRG